MDTTTSKSALNRKSGKHQLEAQRACILDAAESLFLQNGIENTTMVGIAGQAGITRVTLYRYFANRDEIAVEIQVRMLSKISAATAVDDGEIPGEFPLGGLKEQARSMIRKFDQLQDAFRYIGMFDKIYLDNAPDAALTQWTKAQLISSEWGRKEQGELHREHPHTNEVPVILNTIIWFLEKLALRGELTWSDKDIPLEAHLATFEKMIMGYFDHLSAQEPPLK